MSLTAPLAVPVEVRATDRRVFRLSREVGEHGLTLERAAPFEVGRPMTIRFMLPTAAADDPAAAPLTLRATVELTDRDGDGEEGGRALSFIDPPRDAQRAIARYVIERLGLRVAAAR